MGISLHNLGRHKVGDTFRASALGIWDVVLGLGLHRALIPCSAPIFVVRFAGA